MKRTATTITVRGAAALVVALLLASCATREIPANNASGSDAMKKSPCACAQIEYTPPAPRWLG